MEGGCSKGKMVEFSGVVIYSDPSFLGLFQLIFIALIPPPRLIFYSQHSISRVSFPSLHNNQLLAACYNSTVPSQ